METQAMTQPQAIIMAAGQGTRMQSDLPKVVHEAAGKPMVWWVVQACKQAGVSRCVVVVGYKADIVQSALADEDDIVYVEQLEQLGTGHAAQMAEPAFENEPECDVFVLAGDGPLIQGHTLSKVLEAHRSTNAVATLATTILDNPTGYGRIVRADDDSFGRIVEQKDCDEQQAAITEINPGYYCFNSRELFETLPLVKDNNSQGEIYLTDVPGILKSQDKTVSVVDAVPPEDVLSANTLEQLAECDRILRERQSA
jgi:bifunctional UDP-N-acetylglucosamine pyrophosphorylase/glucosamine-1-phosphate N-acetyltransferase